MRLASSFAAAEGYVRSQCSTTAIKHCVTAPCALIDLPAFPPAQVSQQWIDYSSLEILASRPEGPDRVAFDIRYKIRQVRGRP